MRKLILCGLVVAVSAAIGGILTATPGVGSGGLAAGVSRTSVLDESAATLDGAAETDTAVSERTTRPTRSNSTTERAAAEARLDGARTVRIWQSDKRRASATIGVEIRSSEGRPTHYRNVARLACEFRDPDNVWRAHGCSANFGTRLVRGTKTVRETWSEVSSGADGRIVVEGAWTDVSCRGLYTAELVVFQIGIASEVFTAKGEGLAPSNGVWADC